MNKNSVIKVAKKLKALAEKAHGPEAEAAKAKLKSYCLKHGIDSADYDTEVFDVSVEFKNEQEMRILNNVITMILQSNRVEADIKQNSVHFKCTTKQLKNITDAYDHYKKIYYNYVDALAIALIAKNKIQHIGVSDEKSMEYEMTAEERDEFEKIKKDLESEFKKNNPEVSDEPKTAPSEKSAEERDKQKQIIEKFLFVMEETPWSPPNNNGLFLN